MKNFIYLIIASFVFILSSYRQKEIKFSSVYDFSDNKSSNIKGKLIIDDYSIFMEIIDENNEFSSEEFRIINKTGDKYYIHSKSAPIIFKGYIEKTNNGWELYKENGYDHIKLQ
jgi:uncharacterized membrane protein